jgi:hypothetical protein
VALDAARQTAAWVPEPVCASEPASGSEPASAAEPAAETENTSESVPASEPAPEGNRVRMAGDVPAGTPSGAWADPADALVFMAEAFLAVSADGRAGGGGRRARGAADRFTLLVHVAATPDAQSAPIALTDGTVITAETLRRVACDAGLIPVLDGPHGETLDVGRRRRSVPPALRRALARRDGGCRFPGCTNHRFTDAHHVRHWLHGGDTRLDNLVTLCRRHHRLVHEGGFSVARGTGRAFVFRAPDGGPLPPVPTLPAPGPMPSFPPLQAPRWDGDAIEYSWAVDDLLASGAS